MSSRLCRATSGVPTVAAVAVAVLVTGSACTHPVALPAAPSTSAVDSAAPRPLPSGIVAIVNGNAGSFLGVFDARTGQQVRSIALPTAKLISGQFSPDWSRLAWIKPSGVAAFAELRGDAYVQTATLTLQQIAPHGRRLLNLGFRSMTGQLVVEWQGDENGIGSGAAVLDPNHLDAKPVETRYGFFDVDGYGDPADDQVASNSAGEQVKVVASPRQLLSALVIGPTKDGRVRYTYNCSGPALDLTHIACFGEVERAGAIGMFVRDSDEALTGTVRQLVAPGPAVTALLVSPDRTRLLAQRADSWITLPADGSGTPRTAFRELQTASDGKLTILAWI